MKRSKQTLTVGFRARLKNRKEDYYGHDVLLHERTSHGRFSVMVLSKDSDSVVTVDRKSVKAPFRKTHVIAQMAWIDQKHLELVDTNLEENLTFMDWYTDHSDDICPKCYMYNRNPLDVDGELLCRFCKEPLLPEGGGEYYNDGDF